MSPNAPFLTEHGIPTEPYLARLRALRNGRPPPPEADVHAACAERRFPHARALCERKR